MSKKYQTQDSGNNASSSEARRKVLKSVAAGGGAFAAASALPSEWAKPVLNSVMVPAHAQTSQPPIVGVFAANDVGIALNNSSKTDNYALLEYLVAPAQAQALTSDPALNNHIVDGICGTGDGGAGAVRVMFDVKEDTSVTVVVIRVGDDIDDDTRNNCVATTSIVDNSTIMDVSVQLDDDEFLDLSGMTITEAQISGNWATALRSDRDDGGDAHDPCNASFTALATMDAFPAVTDCSLDDD